MGFKATSMLQGTDRPAGRLFLPRFFPSMTRARVQPARSL